MTDSLYNGKGIAEYLIFAKVILYPNKRSGTIALEPLLKNASPFLISKGVGKLLDDKPSPTVAVS